MRYLALGDSISIDDYTGVKGGGAASQLARKVGAHGDSFVDLTRDGQVTSGVLRDLARRIAPPPEIVTLTIGGNDLLQATEVGAIVANIRTIAASLAELRVPTVFNTVYDPTDGDDSLAAELGLTPDSRLAFRDLNRSIAETARRHGFLLCDLETLFRGHGIAAKEPWIVLGIEPNLAGATAIAEGWHELLGRPGAC